VNRWTVPAILIAGSPPLLSLRYGQLSSIAESGMTSPAHPGPEIEPILVKSLQRTPTWFMLSESILSRSIRCPVPVRLRR
jgi:hypothetical protein